MQHPLFTLTNQLRAAVAALALCCAAVPTTAAAVASPPEMSAPVHAPAVAEHACPTDWGAAGVHNAEPLMLALAASPRNWTTLLAGDNPRPTHFAAPTPAPARDLVVAQSADPAAPVGDNRLATLGDLQEFQRESRKDNRVLLEAIADQNKQFLTALNAQNQRIDQLSQRIDQQNRRIDQLALRIDQHNQRVDMLSLGIQDGMNLIWATMLGGFVALFVAFMTTGREKKPAAAPNQQPAAETQRAPLFDGMKPAIAAAIFALVFPLIVALSQ